MWTRLIWTTTMSVLVVVAATVAGCGKAATSIPRVPDARGRSDRSLIGLLDGAGVAVSASGYLGNQRSKVSSADRLGYNRAHASQGTCGSSTRGI